MVSEVGLVHKQTGTVRCNTQTCGKLCEAKRNDDHNYDITVSHLRVEQICMSPFLCSSLYCRVRKPCGGANR